MIEAVLFDWGGTLVDGAWSDEIALRATRAALEAIGRNEIDPVDVNRWFEINESVFRLDSTDELERYMGTWQWAVGGGAHLHPDALRLLGELRSRGLRLGLISNTVTPGRFLTVHLEEQGLADSFDVVLFSADHGKRKPHPSIFEAALDELGVSSDRALFVGDSPDADIAGAHAIGMTTVQAIWFVERESKDGVTPDYVAREPLEVLDIIDRCLAATPS